MEFEAEHGRLLDAFVSAMTQGANNNTYKFALARFLLDHSICDTKSQGVSYGEIAECFFDYYWPQECKSRLRQGPQTQTPRVIKIIRTKFGEGYHPKSLADVKGEHSTAVSYCIQKITKHCFNDVIPRLEDDAEHYFGKRRGNKSYRRIFYDYIAMEYHDASNNRRIDPGGGIRVNPHLMEFFHDNYKPLLCVVMWQWLKFLEKVNSGMPRLSEKLDGSVFGPRNQNDYLQDLKMTGDRCFYCNAGLKPGRYTHVDHFLPYDYIGNTDMWNLVLACQICNSTKSNKIPPECYVTKLKLRNSVHRATLRRLESSLDTMRGGESDIDWHYRNAKRHGYPEWEGPIMTAKSL